MTHELIIKDERGKVRITIDFVSFSYGQTDRMGNNFRYDVRTSYIPKGKRTEIFSSEIAKDSEIYAAKMELWYLIKP